MRSLIKNIFLFLFNLRRISQTEAGIFFDEIGSPYLAKIDKGAYGNEEDLIIVTPP